MLMGWLKQLRIDASRAIPASILRYKRYIRWGLRLGLVILLIDAGYIWGLMPDWKRFTRGPIQKSRMMADYEHEQTQNSNWPNLRWYPVPFDLIPAHLRRAVVVAEDSRFYQHKGFDQEAISLALQYNLSKGNFVYGASTISQQTIKNLLFSPSKNPMRKFHEAILTYVMEQKVGKQRILETYLNIAEFGRGIYGVEAAARHYFHKSVTEIDLDEAIELAATLPSPVKNNPASRSAQFLRHREKIRTHMDYSRNSG